MEYEVLVISHQNVFNIYFTVDGALCSIRYSPLSSALALVQHDPFDDTYVLNVFNQLPGDTGFFAAFFPRESRAASPAASPRNEPGKSSIPRSSSNQFLGSPFSMMLR
jgi:hypothetical protein